MGDCLHFFEGWSKWIFCASFELKNELGTSCEKRRIKPGQLVPENAEPSRLGHAPAKERLDTQKDQTSTT